MIVRLALSLVLALTGAGVTALVAAPDAPAAPAAAPILADGLAVAPAAQTTALDPADEVVVTEVDVVLPAVDAAGDVVATPEVVDAQQDPEVLVADEVVDETRVVSEVLETDGFQMLGVTWPADVAVDDLGAQVRTRAAGEWSPWRPLEVADDAPDAGTADAAAAAGLRGGTDPLWVGEAEAVQVSFPAEETAGPADLSLTLVDVPEADATAVPGVATSGEAVVENAVLLTGGSATATAVPAAMTAAPTVISRAAWGARAQVCTPDVASTLVGVVVHHTAGSNDYATQAQAMAQIRGDQAYHIDARGWCDIGYNFLVDKWGNIYEGRANSLTKAVIGVHAGGFNTSTVGISMLGNYSSITPSAAVQESVAQIAAWRLRQYHRDPAGTMTYKTLGGENSSYPAGSTATLPVILGHRDVAFTACPGIGGYSTLGWVRARARQLISPGLVNPTASPSAPTPGATVTLRAGTISNIYWRLEVVDVRTGSTIASSIGYAQESFGGVVATWDGRDGGGTVVDPGTYNLVLSGSEVGTGTAVTTSTTPVNVVLPQNPATVAAAPLVGDLRFVPLTPVRALDTRPSATPLRAASRIDLPLAGHYGVPADARAVAVNITATNATATTHVRAWPAGQAVPGASVLNTDPQRGAVASAVVLGVGGEGKISLYNNAGTTHLVVDVTGYYVEAGTGGYGQLPTALRALDTRVTGGRMATNARRTVAVAGLGGVPADATAVVVNVTSVVSAGNGYVTVVPAGASGTQTSSVNHQPGGNVANRATVALSGGALDVVVGGAASDVVLDVVGWYGPGGTARFTPVAPVRAFDTRQAGGPLAAGESRTFAVGVPAGLPAGTVAAVMTLTATQQTSPMTYLTAWPAGAARPGTSDLNTGRGRDQANSAVVGLGTGASVQVYNDLGTTQVIGDVLGYFR